jgi:hypothetical protein
VKVAEAAKVIENTQRDLNIALINEFSLIFHRLGVDTSEVLAAAATKWNFLNFRPGLVGGHCIGVDPYYLTHKAEALGYHPEVILAGRRINDGMGGYIARELIKEMIRRSAPVKGARVLVMGLAFKENCPDLRNTRVIDIIRELADYDAKVDVWDPWIDAGEARHEYGLDLIAEPADGVYDGRAAVATGVCRPRRGRHPRSARRAPCCLDVKAMLPARPATCGSDRSGFSAQAKRPGRAVVAAPGKAQPCPPGALQPNPSFDDGSASRSGAAGHSGLALGAFPPELPRPVRRGRFSLALRSSSLGSERLRRTPRPPLMRRHVRTCS